MMRTALPLTMFLLLLFATAAAADPQPARKISHPASPCTIHATAGEYPFYSVTKDDRTIYAPSSDGIVQALFSPSGRFLAFVGSEIDWVDLRPGEGHSVVILDCEAESLSGFSQGFPMGDFKWLSEREFEYTDSATEQLVRGAH